MDNLFLKSSELTRRGVVKGLAAGLLGVSITPEIAKAQTVLRKGGGRAKSVIFINVAGGLSQVDSFDIKDDNKEANQASSPIKSNADGILVGKHFPGMAKHMDKFAAINSMAHTQGTHGHAAYLTRTSYESRGTIVHPDLGAWANKLGGPSETPIPSYVKIGSGASGTGFFSSKYAALPISDPEKGIQHVGIPSGLTQDEFGDRIDFLNRLNSDFERTSSNRAIQDYSDIYDQALTMMRSEDLEAFDLSKEKSSVREAYGKNKFGSSCLLARRLVQKGIRYISFSHNGWDDHGEIYSHMPDRAVSLDQGVAALMADLSSLGLLESTLVVFTSEFGRGAKVNNIGGRDHNPVGYTSLLAGAGIVGGQKYGKTDPTGGRAVEKKVSPADLNATIGHALGLPIEQIEYSPTGRPFQLGNKHGKPVTELFQGA